jgi:hypothetical protein
MSSVRTPEKTGEKSGKGKRAILKDAVPCGAGVDAERARTTAPRGEYEIETVDCAGVSCIGLCSCSTQNRFTLSFDAYLQHLNEGRIALTN